MGFVTWISLCVIVLCISCSAKKYTQQDEDRFSNKFKNTSFLKNTNPKKMLEFKGKLANRAEKQRAAQGNTFKKVQPPPKDPKERETKSIPSVNEKAEVADLLFDGDIALTDKQIDIMEKAMNQTNANRAKRQAINGQTMSILLWENRTINFQIDSRFDPEYKKLFLSAVREFWEPNTCLTFTESTTADPRLYVYHGAGCWSFVGSILYSGLQDLSLGYGCEHAAPHEIGHALGLWHEQARHDRDAYITVNVDNIKPDYVDQFDKKTPQTNDNYGVPYDYSSMMHYPANAFTKNGGDTIVASNPHYRTTMGNIHGTFHDLEAINKLYGCADVCANVYNSVVCQNGGFPNPKDCTRCVCPRGLRGKMCEGEKVHFVEDYFTVIEFDEVGINATVPQSTLSEKAILFKTSEGRKLSIRIITQYTDEEHQVYSCELGCNSLGVELFWKKDPRNAGLRFCCQNDYNKRIVTEGNVARIVMYTNIGLKVVGVEAKSIPFSTISGVQPTNATIPH